MILYFTFPLFQVQSFLNTPPFNTAYTALRWCISPVFTLCIDLFHARVLGQGFTPTRQKLKPAMMMLIPGQVHSVAVASGAATTTKKRRTRKRRKGKGRPAAGAEGKAERIRYGRPGGRPNVFWLHVSEADLRSHPRYVPLAPPRCLGLLTDWAAVSQFRQDSRQWSLLHNGRLTTSRAAGALGILEPHAASVLNVPRGLRGSHKAQHTLAHLRQQTAFEILNLEDATACLCVYAVDEGERDEWRREWEAEKDAKTAKTWRESWGGDTSWRAHVWSHPYKVWVRRKRNHRSNRHDTSANYGPVQMRWGSVHEATAVLCALNFSMARACTWLSAECFLAKPWWRMNITL